jgi:uncharacterized protein
MTSLDLRRIRLRAGEQYRDEHEVELQPLELGGQRYLPVPGRVAAAVTITRASTGTVFELAFRVRLHGPCQRCLTDAVVERDIAVREYQATNPGRSEDLDSPYVVNGRLALSDWGRDSLALSLPEQILCRPECAGLCPVCGEDLNENPHEHEEERGDPRWAALERLREEL